jgi:hypothetical protein
MILPCRSRNSRANIWFAAVDKENDKAESQPIIEKIPNMLPGWKVALLNTTERSVLIHAVLTIVLMYILIAMNVPK